MPLIAFKDFRCARIILSGIGIMHMIQKEQLNGEGSTPNGVSSIRLLITCSY